MIALKKKKWLWFAVISRIRFNKCGWRRLSFSYTEVETSGGTDFDLIKILSSFFKLKISCRIFFFLFLRSNAETRFFLFLFLLSQFSFPPLPSPPFCFTRNKWDWEGWKTTEVKKKKKFNLILLKEHILWLNYYRPPFFFLYCFGIILWAFFSLRILLKMAAPNKTRTFDFFKSLSKKFERYTVRDASRFNWRKKIFFLNCPDVW